MHKFMLWPDAPSSEAASSEDDELAPLNP